MNKTEFLRSIDQIMEMDGRLAWDTPLHGNPKFDSLTVTSIVSLADMEFDVLLRATEVKDAATVEAVVEMVVGRGGRFA